MAFDVSKSFSPIYQQVADHLKSEIERGGIKPGEKLPSEPELARQFGINHLTLRKGMKILREQNLIYQHAGKGTYVLDSKKEEKTCAIGITGMPAKAVDPYFLLLTSGIQTEMAKHTYCPMFFNDKDAYADIVDRCGHFNLKGLIFFAPLDKDIKYIKKIQRAGIPFVVMGASSSKIVENNFTCVDIDHRSGTVEAMDYLIKLGHKRIAYINKEERGVFVREQVFNGYCDSLKKNNIKLNRRLTIKIPSNSESSCREACNKVLKIKPRPTAMFVAGHSIIIKTWRFLQEKNIRIPKDISFAGYDNYGYCEYLTPKLTTVDQPVALMGENAVKLLREQIINNKNNKDKTIILKSKFVLGKSCRLNR